jgi:hypothetical protein
MRNDSDIIGSCVTESSCHQSVFFNQWSLVVFLLSRTIDVIQGDSFGTKSKKMRISQRLFIRF